MTADQLIVSLRIELAIAALPWAEVAACLEEVAASGVFHAEALNRAYVMLQIIPDRPGRGGLRELEAMLVTSGDERLRYIALATLLGQVKRGQIWTEEYRTRLNLYRADPAPLVAATAQFTFPPNEND